MGLFWFDQKIHYRVRRYCEKFKPESCPDCGGKKFSLVYEKFSMEGSWVRVAYWLCENCARKINVPLPQPR